MILKQLHLNDVDKTPIVPIISNDSIPVSIITEDKLSMELKDKINNKQDNIGFAVSGDILGLFSNKGGSV